MTLKNSVKFETKSGLISNNRSVLSKTQVSLSDEHNKLINEITDKGWREFTKNMLLRYIFEMNHNNNLIENSKDSTTKDPKLITQYKRYKENLTDAYFLIDEKGKPSFHKLVMMTKNRDALQKHLANAGIETKIHYRQILNEEFAGLYTYPYADNICKNAISLPIYPYLKMQEVDYICEVIKEFYVR